jgi:hypothetical protein
VGSVTCQSVTDIVDCLFSLWHETSVFVQDMEERD